MISVTHVSKHFDNVAAVNDISFEVKEGENLILLGTSGCGKTTTLRMINRLIIPDSGSVQVNGMDVSSQQSEQLRRNIGYVLQHNALFPHYTVAENIAVVPKLLQWDKKKIAARTEELMHALQLAPEKYLHAYPAELSGGQQQRVNVARAIAAYPPVLLMDEPFGALDPVTRAGIVKDFVALDEFRKKTIVMVTHDIDEAFQLGNRICLMDKGEIVQIGTPIELLFRSANEQVKTFFDDHYFQLALKATKIEDIWPELNNSISVHQDNNMLTTQSSVWDAMEMMTKKNWEQLSVRNEMNNETKQVNVAELLSAFNAYKNA